MVALPSAWLGPHRLGLLRGERLGQLREESVVTDNYEPPDRLGACRVMHRPGE
jgi:hypothetical protein